MVVVQATVPLGGIEPDCKAGSLSHWTASCLLQRIDLAGRSCGGLNHCDRLFDAFRGHLSLASPLHFAHPIRYRKPIHGPGLQQCCRCMSEMPTTRIQPSGGDLYFKVGYWSWATPTDALFAYRMSCGFTHNSILSPAGRIAASRISYVP